MQNHTPFPAAMPAPRSDVTELTTSLVEEALELSRKSPRKRIILPLHKGPESTLHRMLNAMQPGTYIRPHRHIDPPKAESLVVLSGALRLVVFNETGNVTRWHDVTASSSLFGMDIEPGVIHSMLVLEPDTVMFEVKPGPYSPATDKDFMLWAPQEDTPEALDFLESLTRITDS